MFFGRAALSVAKYHVAEIDKFKKPVFIFALVGGIFEERVLLRRATALRNHGQRLAMYIRSLVFLLFQRSNLNPYGQTAKQIPQLWPL